MSLHHTQRTDTHHDTATPRWFVPSHHEYTDPPLTDAPPGCRAVSGPGGEFTLTASTRSLPRAILTGPVALLWNGMLALPLLMVVCTMLTHLHLAPGPMASLALPIPPAITAVMLLFLLPFAGVGLLLATIFFMAAAGNVRLHVRADVATISTGVGPLSLRREFFTPTLRSIRIRQAPHAGPGWFSPSIEVATAERTLRFGSGLRADRLEWLCAAARSFLLPKCPSHKAIRRAA
jgi:hypothetical protein